MKKVLLSNFMFLLFFSIFFIACNKDKDTDTNTDTNVPVSGVTLSSEVVTLNVGESISLTANVFPDSATEKGVSWESSDETKVTVNNGVLKGIAEGKATITVTTKDGNKTATCEVNVAVKMKTLHDFTVDDIYGNPFDFSQLKGKKVLIVNVASKCGYTPHYAQLQDLYEKYAASNFVIIGFPCNDFGGQEPGSHEEILDFCQENYGVTFPLMSKVKVKGTNKAPIYKWLTEKSENGVMDAEIQWNFQKFMINENGQIVDCILPQSSFYNKIVAWITNG